MRSEKAAAACARESRIGTLRSLAAALAAAPLHNRAPLRTRIGIRRS
ncbi:MAG: hypothetical protein AVDCRST_MAG42-3354 [uncultured Chthoniobacterales bacterium]|uniref:Uncharacterized protein n=1 Tax=uncultured Chthoniobacterales bacterium TaxID=1836801 RepID=A0A6J4J3C7_9BACT|nr:MAG: hypothetical protein AVDCRST_MAG42-3354 [uncultured Chthoniobacterales bacterium]